MGQCRFREAETVRIMIGRAERDERDRSFAALQHDFDDSLGKLARRQDDEVHDFNQRAMVRIAQLRQERMGKKSAYFTKQRKMESLEKRIADPERLWNNCHNERAAEISSGRAKVVGTPLKFDMTDVPGVSARDENLIALPRLDLRRGKTAQ
jgi:hypothetical protein